MSERRRLKSVDYWSFTDEELDFIPSTKLRIKRKGAREKVSGTFLMLMVNEEDK